MIFSDKIYKINNGQNATLFANNASELNLFLFDKTLKLYKISLINNRSCVFYNEYNYEKIIQINKENYCVCSNDFLTIIDETKF